MGGWARPDELCPWFPAQRRCFCTSLCLQFCSSELLGGMCLYPELINCGLSTKCQPFLGSSFRSRKSRWPSEVLPQGACITRAVSEAPVNPHDAKWMPTLVVTLTGSYSEVRVTFNCSTVHETNTRLDVFVLSLNVILL